MKVKLVVSYFDNYSVIIQIGNAKIKAFISDPRVNSSPSDYFIEFQVQNPINAVDKVEKLNQIVQEMEYGRKETVNSESEMRDERGIMSEKVLDALKKRIKTNYEQLYNNYPDNKTKILKQIQTVQTNISGENVMKHKQEEVIKERAKYDKLKVIV